MAIELSLSLRLAVAFEIQMFIHVVHMIHEEFLLLSMIHGKAR